MNACWNMMIRRIFGYNKWESIKPVLAAVDTTVGQHVAHFTFPSKSQHVGPLSFIFYALFCFT